MNEDQLVGWAIFIAICVIAWAVDRSCNIDRYWD